MLRRPVAVYRIIDEDELLGSSSDSSVPRVEPDSGARWGVGEQAAEPMSLVSGNRSRRQWLAISALGVGVLGASLALSGGLGHQQRAVMSPRVVTSSPGGRSRAVGRPPQAASSFVVARPRRRIRLRPRTRRARALPLSSPHAPSVVATRPVGDESSNRSPVSPTQEFGFER
jgi:hypothetical protein